MVVLDAAQQNLFLDHYSAVRASQSVSASETRATVSIMETNAERGITPDDARRALEQADAEEQATLNPPLPAWYFPAIAVAIFAIFALNSIADPSPVGRVFIVIAVVVTAVGLAALVSAVSFSRPGYRRVHVRWAPTIITAAIAMLFPITALVLSAALGPWVRSPAGAALAAGIMGIGILYGRSRPRA